VFAFLRQSAGDSAAISAYVLEMRRRYWGSAGNAGCLPDME
jgi:hypothetical protein